MTNQVGEKQNQELGEELESKSESTTVSSIDPDRLNEVSAIEAPISLAFNQPSLSP